MVKITNLQEIMKPLHYPASSSIVSGSQLEHEFIEKFTEAAIGFTSKETEALIKFASGSHILRQLYSRVVICLETILKNEIASLLPSTTKIQEVVDSLIPLLTKSSQKKVFSPYYVAIESILFPAKFEKIDFENVFVLSFEKLKKTLKGYTLSLSPLQMIQILQNAILKAIESDEFTQVSPIEDPLKSKISDHFVKVANIGLIRHIEQIREIFHQVKNAYLLLVNVKVINRDAFDLSDVLTINEVSSNINPFQIVIPLLKNRLFQIKDLLLDGRFPSFDSQSGSFYLLLRSFEYAGEKYSQCSDMLSHALIEKKNLIESLFQKLSFRQFSQSSELSDEILWNDLQIMNASHYTREDILKRQVSFLERIVSHLQEVIAKEFLHYKPLKSAHTLSGSHFNENILSFSDAYDIGISAGEITLRKLRETAFIRSQLLKKSGLQLPLAEMLDLKQMNQSFAEVGPKNTKDLSRSPWSNIITSIENEIYCDNSIYIPLGFELQTSILRELWNLCDDNNGNPSTQKALNSVIRGCLNHENHTSTIHSAFSQTGS